MDRKLTPADLSPDQLEVFDALRDWMMDASPLLTIGGLAGTGKTTLLGVFAAWTSARVAYATFTGRAASVLTRKLRAAGSTATAVTLHSLLYIPILSPSEEIRGWRKRKAEEARVQYDLIVVDEASMVGGSIFDDLKELDLPILAVGDHGQLPPVMDSGDLMKSPDLVLEKIHRQAEGNPIIRFAHHVRNTGKLDRNLADGKAIVFGRKGQAGAVLREAYLTPSAMDVGILCWTNQSRVQLNGMARKALFHSGPPKCLEIVICLKNDPPVFNGMRGILEADSIEPCDDGAPWELYAPIRFPEEGLAAQDFVLCAPQFCRPKTFASLDELKAIGVSLGSIKDLGLFDFGYSLTTHKSQGSSFKHVVGFIDRPVKPDDNDWRRWMYTLVTRASERLTILL